MLQTQNDIFSQICLRRKTYEPQARNDLFSFKISFTFGKPDYYLKDHSG
jgi:hypothetical protein